VEIHDLVLISKFLGKLKKQSCLQWTIFMGFFTLRLSLFILSKSIQTASLVNVHIRVGLRPLNKFIININSTSTNI